ncbi:hypothetical protein NDU88_002621 [Pleurodeles waltl]|uniref:Uncharacterized protein n=1 Tax=Pleurodeles waltl TaxID=8319 RepID=A0AAV7VZV0_PLEWA|nr:hypothetical protein NDU88_002621 [Pleurodeles waltl]
MEDPRLEVRGRDTATGAADAGRCRYHTALLCHVRDSSASPPTQGVSRDRGVESRPCYLPGACAGRCRLDWKSCPEAGGEKSGCKDEDSPGLL